MGESRRRDILAALGRLLHAILIGKPHDSHSSNLYQLSAEMLSNSPSLRAVDDAIGGALRDQLVQNVYETNRTILRRRRIYIVSVVGVAALVAIDHLKIPQHDAVLIAAGVLIGTIVSQWALVRASMWLTSLQSAGRHLGGLLEGLDHVYSAKWSDPSVRAEVNNRLEKIATYYETIPRQLGATDPLSRGALQPIANGAANRLRRLKVQVAGSDPDSRQKLANELIIHLTKLLTGRWTELPQETVIYPNQGNVRELRVLWISASVFSGAALLGSVLFSQRLGPVASSLIALEGALTMFFIRRTGLNSVGLRQAESAIKDIESAQKAD